MYRVSDKDFRSDHSGTVLAKMKAAAKSKPNGEVKHLRAELAQFEYVHGFTTAEMRSRLKSGSLEESASVSRWVIVAKLYDRVSETL